MTLPKPKAKKLIKEAEFVRIAKKVQQSFKEEAKFLSERKNSDGHSNSHNFYCCN